MVLGSHGEAGHPFREPRDPFREHFRDPFRGVAMTWPIPLGIPKYGKKIDALFFCVF